MAIHTLRILGANQTGEKVGGDSHAMISAPRGYSKTGNRSSGQPS